jgi:acyl-CoA dehydrogenase
MDTLDTLAGQVAEAAAPHADRHDREGSFAVEGITTAREIGYLAAPVPVELGGAGALTREVAAAQRVVARGCGSTGLACAMHLHLVLAAAWRWRRGDEVVEPLLRRVADDHIVLASTGGNDWRTPSAVATPVDGGWRVTGRKVFASISPAADAAATFAVIGEAAPGAEVIAFGLPLGTDGVRIEETWDAAGMRATGSHDIVLEDAFVAEAQVTGRRTWGELDRPLLVAAMHSMPVIYATYLGVAEGLVDAVLAAGRPDEGSARLVGLVDFHLRSAAWAIDGAFAELGDDPDPTPESYVTVQQMKRVVTLATQEVATAAAELAGGRAYARRGPIDRMIRDLRAALYHPDPPEATLVHAGRARLAALAAAG